MVGSSCVCVLGRVRAGGGLHPECWLDQPSHARDPSLVSDPPQPPSLQGIPARSISSEQMVTGMVLVCIILLVAVDDFFGLSRNLRNFVAVNRATPTPSPDEVTLL